MIGPLPTDAPGDITKVEEPSSAVSIEQADPSTSIPAPASTSGPADGGDAQQSDIKVYNPISSSSTPNTEPDDTFFEPTLADVQSHHSSVLARNKRLNEAPLLTAKYRDAEKAEREKVKRDRWPNFSDGTIIQNVFPSDSPIQPVYEFIRTALTEEVMNKPFILYQPPKTRYPEHPILSTQPKNSRSKPSYARSSIVTPANYGPIKGGTPQGLQGGTGGKETLYELGLVPQSVLLIRWEADEEMNASTYPAPIQEHLKAQSQPLPPSVPKAEEPTGKQKGNAIPGPGQAGAGAGTGEKKIPK
uniref:UBX domain-containing protein n=1 Tax=Kwoniella bestiolae CBS 10118 TaxID=1296100 RepID=A0A1B9FXK5_9TREE|nr:hypothetical protein I302_06485 [Kwoniella bestiolae CBS 10118]OCF23502.1 hypothetical protein I302_06485 [Kwoniella bestiolae CBS 10118]